MRGVTQPAVELVDFGVEPFEAMRNGKELDRPELRRGHRAGIGPASCA